MKTLHTPGPWAVNRHGLILAPDKSVICTTFDELEEERNNARLIAAAPELLAALQDCLALAEAMRDTLSHEPGLRGLLASDSPRMNNARAAIAKATGN